jgi:hypothetical protein
MALPREAAKGKTETLLLIASLATPSDEEPL